MSDSTDELRQAITGIIQRVGVDTRTPARAPDTDAWDALRDSAFTAVGVPADAGGAVSYTHMTLPTSDLV